MSLTNISWVAFIAGVGQLIVALGMKPLSIPAISAAITAIIASFLPSMSKTVNQTSVNQANAQAKAESDS